MLKLLKNMRRKEVLMVLLCTVLVAVQVYFDLRLPDYMTDLTTLIKTSGATAGTWKASCRARTSRTIHPTCCCIWAIPRYPTTATAMKPSWASAAMSPPPP